MACIVVAAGCGDAAPTTLPPEGQILLYVTTDAPLPPPSGKNLVSDPTLCPAQPRDAPPLFDTLQVDVYQPDGMPCPGCTRRFALDCDTVDSGRASLGIADEKRFLEFMGTCFGQKRKTLRNNLRSIASDDCIHEALTACGLRQDARAEQLSLTQFATLFKLVV